MVEDIVVNKIIQQEGFDPFGLNYLTVVQQETKSARKGRDHYRQYKDPLLRHRIMVFRYILAWGYLQYFDLETYTRRTLSKFLKAFDSSFPEQFKMANQAKQIILENDIFTPTGFQNVVERILALWELDHLVEVN